MVKTCKYAEQNRKEGKCNDYFISESKGGVCMCRLTEWKKKQGVCPYDKTIQHRVSPGGLAGGLRLPPCRSQI